MELLPTAYPYPNTTRPLSSLRTTTSSSDIHPVAAPASPMLLATWTPRSTHLLRSLPFPEPYAQPASPSPSSISCSTWGVGALEDDWGCGSGAAWTPSPEREMGLDEGAAGDEMDEGDGSDEDGSEYSPSEADAREARVLGRRISEIRMEDSNPRPHTRRRSSISTSPRSPSPSPSLSATSAPSARKIPLTLDSSVCYNCGTDSSPFWRRSCLVPGAKSCNACGLYERQHNRPRQKTPSKRTFSTTAASYRGGGGGGKGGKRGRKAAMAASARSVRGGSAVSAP